MTASGKKRLNKRETFLLTTVFLAGFLFFGWQLIGAPVYKEFVHLYRHYNMLAAENEQLHAQIGKAEEIEARWAAIQPEKERLERTLPCYCELPRVLGTMETFLEDYKGSLQYLKTGETINEDSYITVGMAFEARGRPSRLLALLRRIESFPHLVIIDSLKWSSDDKADYTLQIVFRFIFICPDQLAGAVEPDRQF